MPTRAPSLAIVPVLVVLSACGASVAPSAPPADPPSHHELHLPPVGASVRVSLDGRTADVVLASVPHEGNAAPLASVWKAAFPADDAAPLHFDLVGSDGFHPASRPRCARPLTGAEIEAARIDVASHDVSFDDALNLPGCYRVKAVVTLSASR
jgi:hypothetical protein